MPSESCNYNKSRKIKRNIPKGRTTIDSESNNYVQSVLQMNNETESALPPVFRARLQDLFMQIEKEFESMYIENCSLQEKVDRLNERLDKESGTDKNIVENVDIESITSSVRSSVKQKMPNSSQQKLKTANKLKAHTSKIVSSFKAPPVNCAVVKEFYGHRDGIWDVSVGYHGKSLIGTASAGIISL